MAGIEKIGLNTADAVLIKGIDVIRKEQDNLNKLYERLESGAQASQGEIIQGTQGIPIATILNYNSSARVPSDAIKAIFLPNIQIKK